VPGGPSGEQLGRTYLVTEARRAAVGLADTTDLDLRKLFDELVRLPELDLSLVVPLPDVLSPDLNRLLDAVARDDPDAGEPYLQAALDELDTIETRVRLARAVRALEAAGRVDPHVAALAMIDLEGGARSLLTASLVQAASIATGVARTPGGLLVAAA
jgi:cytosine/adenosine deaminase-related metal-dependent hydrolase